MPLIRAPRPKLPLRYYARPDLVRPLNTVIRETIERALILCAGDKIMAAAQLGMNLRGLRRKLKQYKIDDIRGNA